MAILIFTFYFPLIPCNNMIIGQTIQKPYLEKTIIQTSEIATFWFKRGKMDIFSFETATFDPFYWNLIFLIIARDCHIC